LLCAINTDLDRFQAERARGSSPSIQLAGIKHPVADGKEAAITQARVENLEMPDGPVPIGWPLRIVAKVRNAGDAGLAALPLQLANETVPRSVWLEKGEATQITFENLKLTTADRVETQIGEITQQIQALPKLDERIVTAPFVTFHNTSAEFRESSKGFYIRAGVDYPVMQYGDQYAAIYQRQALRPDSTVVVKLNNPDLVTSWQGRVGIMVRKDISKPGSIGGYVILGSSPAAGSYLEWSTDDSGRLNKHTEFEGFSLWPHWFKLERHGTRFTGY
jgi:hypothetical protein